MSPWVTPLAVAAAILWGWIAIALSLPESLWVDELHSVWCATGTSGEVFQRAELGNQLSTYFWLLRWVGETFGTAESAWRAPSVCAWIGTVMLCGGWLGWLAGRSGRPLALAALALLVLDRLQIFYATEARAYALVALVTLEAWTALAAWSWSWFPLSGRREARWPSAKWVACWSVWWGCDALACWLQPTAILSVAAQFVFVGCLWLRRPRQERTLVELWPLGLGGLALASSLSPALQVLWPVWEHRQRWAAFAAGTALGDVRLLLPLVAFGGPLAIGALLHALLGLKLFSGGRAALHECRSNKAWSAAQWFTRDASAWPADSALRRQWWMWLAAWAVPCLAVYLLTASGIAPLMHRRYVFSAAAPFVLWTAGSIVRLRGRGLRWSVLAAMLAILLVEQGSVRAWREGTWPAAVRGEDWRGAVQWINSQIDPEEPVVVFCASNLIEGAGKVPADAAMREYLTLPLRSIYRVEAASRIVPLANDPSTWKRTVAAEIGRQHQSAWLVVRSSAAGLEHRLQASGMSAGQRRDFGGVQVARDLGFN